jgi:hypothetical protein
MEDKIKQLISELNAKADGAYQRTLCGSYTVCCDLTENDVCQWVIGKLEEILPKPQTVEDREIGF